MTDLNISSLLPTAGVTPKPGKIKDAAQQFEALLIGQILRSERESGGGWLGGGDSSSDCAVEFAEQHFAAVLAQQGGLGLAKLIGKGLEAESQPATENLPQPPASAAAPR
jgi:peptidoglycan hydrolase FlgJ